MVAVSAEHREMRRHHRHLRGGGEDMDAVTGSTVVRDDVMRKYRQPVMQSGVRMNIWSGKSVDRSQI